MIADHSENAQTDALPVFNRVGENLYRHATSGIYYALVKRGGKQFRRSLKTKDRQLASRRLADLRRLVSNLVLSDGSSATFDQVAEQWLAGVRHTMKPASIARRVSCIRNLLADFKGVTIRNLAPKDCDVWLTDRGPHIAASTFAHELGTMKLVFECAVARGLLLVNPTRHLARRRIPPAQIHVPTREQFQNLISAIRNPNGSFGTQGKGRDGADLVELLAYSGCRLAEATSLRWRDVNFERNCVTITGGEKGTKNREPRTTPMTSHLREPFLRIKSAPSSRRNAANPSSTSLAATSSTARP